MMKTRAAVPRIMGRIPVVLTLNMSTAGPEMKRQDTYGASLTTIISRITTRMAMMSTVANPVAPVPKNEAQSKCLALKGRAVLGGRITGDVVVAFISDGPPSLP